MYILYTLIFYNKNHISLNNIEDNFRFHNFTPGARNLENMKVSFANNVIHKRFISADIFRASYYHYKQYKENILHRKISEYRFLR